MIQLSDRSVQLMKQSHLHLMIRSGTDVILAMAVAAELERRGALDLPFINEWTVCFKRYMTQARQYSLSDVESSCGLSASEFKLFCDLYTASPDKLIWREVQVVNKPWRGVSCGVVLVGKSVSPDK